MPYRLRQTVAFSKDQIAVLLLLVNSFSWYYFGQIVIGTLTTEPSGSSLDLLFGIAFPLSIIISAIAGSIILSKMRETRALYGWLFFGVIASLLPALPIGSSFAGSLTMIVILGCSLGSGMPLLLRRFTDSMPVENRGTIGGLTFFMVTVIAAIAATATRMLTPGLLASPLFLSLWRCWSIPTLRALPARNELQASGRGIPFRGLLDNKAFVLYFVAWLMFSMVDGSEEFVISQYTGPFSNDMAIVEPIIAGFSALIGGILADRTGRKKVVIFGFVSLGIAYAVLGISSQWTISWLLYFVIDGIAIGLLWAMFTIVIWGELATRGTEKYYAVGEVPFFLTQIVYLLSTPYVTSVGDMGYGSAFSVAAFFLFIAVIPLLYAPETLPEKKIQERQLRVYTEEALKLKQRAKSR